MEIKFFLLFLACVVFGLFSVYANIKSRDKVLSYLTLWSLYASIVGAVVLLAISFYRLVAG